MEIEEASRLLNAYVKAMQLAEARHFDS